MKNHQISKSFRLTGSLLFAAAVVAGTEAAEGGNWYNGFYISASGGGHTRGRAGEDENTWTDWDPGYNANLAVGYQINQYLRFDIEGSMFHNDAAVLRPGMPALQADAQGEAYLRAFMFNMYFEYPIKDTKFKPYIGAGAGFFKAYLNELSNSAIQPAGIVFSDESEGETFAYQFRAGLGYGLTDNIDLFTGYRYFHGDQVHFFFPGVPVVGDFRASPKEVEIHGAEIGVRFRF